MDLTVFVALTAIAVVLQAGVLLAIYLAVRKTNAKVESLVEEARTKVFPAVETAQSMMVELRPKIDTTIANVSETSALVRAQVERLNATVSDVVDRTRLQVIRADELVGRTLDRVEDATEKVHRTVVTPIRQINGIIQGLSAGLGFLVTGRRRRNGVTVPQDEMFI